MAKKFYFGVGGVARRVRKFYFGVGGVARKVRRAYIGVGGVARPCWSGGELVYYGQAEPLPRADMSGGYGRVYVPSAAAGNKAIVAGYGNKEPDRNYTVYDTNLTRTAISNSFFNSVNYTIGSAASFRSYAVFSGLNAYAYDSALTEKYLGNSGVGQQKAAAAASNTHIIFMGFYSSGDKIFGGAYDSALTNTKLQQSAEKSDLAGARCGNFILFAGGSGKNAVPFSTVEVFDGNLTRTTCTPLSRATYSLNGVNLSDKYAMFAGGKDESNFIEIYNSALTKLSPLYLSAGRRDMFTASNNEMAIFAGGTTGNGASYSSTVEYFGVDLMRKTSTPLSSPRAGKSSCFISNICLFAGGNGKGAINIVDVYSAD